MTEEEILKAINLSPSHQAVALEHLYRKGAEFKRRFKYRGVPEDACDDLLQDVILRIFKSAKDYRGEGGFTDNSAAVWMNKIALNCMNDYFDKMGKSRIVNEGTIDDVAATHPDDLIKYEVNASIDQSERSNEIAIEKCVADAIERFAEDQPDRAKALMMQMDGESIESIARRIGRTAGAAKQYLSQCKQKIKPYVEQCWHLTRVRHVL
jgi:RNA polymerase sigma factor (sigma-70 family)